MDETPLKKVEDGDRFAGEELMAAEAVAIERREKATYEDDEQVFID